jgi:hypothetical protein
MKWVSQDALDQPEWQEVTADVFADLSLSPDDVRKAECQVLQTIDFKSPSRALA